MKQIIKNALILTAITLVSGLCLGFVYELTKVPIAEAQENIKNRAYMEVLPGADTFEEIGVNEEAAEAALKDAGIANCRIDQVAKASKGSDEAGYVISVTDGDAYAGEISFTVGIDLEGKVSGISFLSISESPGLGMEAKDNPEWKTQFYGKEVSAYSVVKTDASSPEQINALSGATISSRAITAGVNGALAYYGAELGGE